jgi:hypothetical protein
MSSSQLSTGPSGHAACRVIAAPLSNESTVLNQRFVKSCA